LTGLITFEAAKEITHGTLLEKPQIVTDSEYT
jgi:hypothetical protein